MMAAGTAEAAGRGADTHPPKWSVRMTWIEDEAEASQEWEIEALDPQDAVLEATSRLGLRPHLVEVRPVGDDPADAGGPQ